ncbi:hypothetical protein QUB37_03740 [Microcoleus sp. AT3-A2]|uniref:hypothetical protein n=1 Tax=Microcoleus sp. AT3-A2 TaxID=2818610 RepID=UPI002FD39174
MKIIHADGSIEDKPDNYRHQWSPADILAIDIPPENRPIVGSNPHHRIKRQSSAELRAGDQKRTAIARQAKADKRKSKSEN